MKYVQVQAKELAIIARELAAAAEGLEKSGSYVSMGYIRSMVQNVVVYGSLLLEAMAVEKSKNP